ncbi:MAG: hypothetical protein IPP74_15725 [Alphaproteobacteria bacterium]|nr:hypothetical protein [Alphaproteobacteria bacterium]
MRWNGNIIGNRRKVMEVFGIYDPLRVINTIPAKSLPIMRADGCLLEGIATVRGRSKAAYYLNIDQMQKGFVVWYWSEDGWNLNANFRTSQT